WTPAKAVISRSLARAATFVIETASAKNAPRNSSDSILCMLPPSISSDIRCLKSIIHVVHLCSSKIFLELQSHEAGALFRFCNVLDDTRHVASGTRRRFYGRRQ